MKPLTRYLLAVLLAVGMVLPGISGEGDGGGGGSGIWILPRASSMTSGLGGPCCIPCPRDSHTFAMDRDVVLGVSTEMGTPIATFVDDISGLPVDLPVTGGTVTIPSTLLAAVSALSIPRGSILISDAAQLGYFVRVICDPAAGTVTVRVK